MRVGIATDHAGFRLKEVHFRRAGHHMGDVAFNLNARTIIATSLFPLPTR